MTPPLTLIGPPPSPPPQGGLPDHIPRGGAEAPGRPLPQRAPVRPLLPGLLGGVGAALAPVPGVPVPLRRLPHRRGPQPQRPAGGPGGVGGGSHAPQLPLLAVQRRGLAVRLPVLLLLGQGGPALVPAVLRGAGGRVGAGLLGRVPAATAALREPAPPRDERRCRPQRVSGSPGRACTVKGPVLIAVTPVGFLHVVHCC